MNPRFRDSPSMVTEASYFLPAASISSVYSPFSSPSNLNSPKKLVVRVARTRGVVAVGHTGAGEVAGDAALFGVQGDGRALEAVAVDQHTRGDEVLGEPVQVLVQRGRLRAELGQVRFQILGGDHLLHLGRLDEVGLHRVGRADVRAAGGVRLPGGIVEQVRAEDALLGDVRLLRSTRWRHRGRSRPAPCCPWPSPCRS